MDSSGGAWFVIRTKPRAEERAADSLRERSVIPFLPCLLVRRRHGSRRWQALEPLFPGYLFARFAPHAEVIARIRWAPGVKHVLGNEGGPMPVPEEVVQHLQERAGERGYILPEPSFTPGMRVRIKNGPMAHLEGIIERSASQAERVRVLLHLINMQVPIEVDSAVLEAS